MPAAGELDRRLRFEARAEVDDGFGNPQAGPWLPQFTVWGSRKDLRGGEGVLAGRLAGRATAVVTIRNTTQARQITTEWRCVDQRTGQVFNVREDPRESADRGFLEFLAESGVAT